MSVCPITMKRPNLDYDGPRRRDAREGTRSRRRPASTRRRAGAWCPPLPPRARRRRHIGGARGAAGPGAGRAVAAGGGPTRRRPTRRGRRPRRGRGPEAGARGRGRRVAGGRRRSAAAARPRRGGRAAAATFGEATATFLGLDGHRRRDAVLAPLPRATTGPVVEEAAAGRRSRSTRAAGHHGASAGHRPRRVLP